ncbi:MAG: AMP-binding protein [Desulfobacterales bacterium]|jgi:fatty-acyl-CoA synthase|nr:AMP-binding protein [Desulfobacterales bacterium]
MQWSVGKIISKWAMLTPEKAAIIYEDERISYRSLNDAANQVAHFFTGKGLKKGDRVAVNLFNCPEFLACYFAAAKLGLIFVPLNFRMVSRELAYQLNSCGCRLLVFHDETQDEVALIRSSVSVEADKFVWLPSFETNFDGPPEWAMDYHASIGGYPTTEPTPDAPVDLDDPLLILYTSGVTGDPKGAVISHGQTYFKSFQYIILADMRGDDIFLSQAPLCHSAGLAVTATPGLCRGVTLLMRKKFDAEQFGKDIETYRATIVFGLTTMFRFVLETGVLDRIDLNSVRVVLGGGERTPATLFNALAEKGLYLQMGFGQTENSGMTSVPKEFVLSKKGSCGLPNFFTEVWVEDDQGDRLSPGEIGNIVASGPNVMTGYWNMPEETAATIVNGKLFTGDLGYTDEEGFLYIADRAKDMYRSGAENVYPAEVERVLGDHKKIENVAIIGVPDERWGETGKAFIVCKENETLTQEEVLGFLKGKVARYKYPKHIEFIESLPLTAWGKVKKGALKRSFLQEGERCLK